MPVTIDGTTGIVAPSVTATPVIGGIVRGTAVASTSGTLDRVRITTVNGTDVFDAGTVSIMYEG